MGRYALVALVALLIVVTGCGSGAYNAQYNQSLERRKRGTGFTILVAAEKAVVDVQGILSIRLPKVFDGSPGWDTPPDENDSYNRFQPDFLKPKDEKKRQIIQKLWRHKRTYETVVAAGGGRNKHIYCYLSIIPVKNKAADELTDELRNSLSVSELGAWQDIMLKTPEGETANWKLLEASGAFEFFDGGETTVRQAGLYQLYLHSSEHYHILVGWLMSRGEREAVITSKDKLERLARPCVAALQVSTEAPEYNDQDL